MANLRVKDGVNVDAFIAATGAGTDGDPFILRRALPADQLAALSSEATLAAVLAALASVAVTGPLTDAQLRAAGVAIIAAALPLPTGAATDATLGSGVGLRSDDNAEHGVYTLSASPGVVTSIAIPAWARIAVVSEPSHRVNWRVDGDPALPGVNALTAGFNVAANGEASLILRSGAATLRLNSLTASATVRVAFRGVPS